MLKTLLPSGIAGAAPTYALVATAPLAERYASALHRHRQNVPPHDQQVRLPLGRGPATPAPGGSRRFSWTRR